MEKMSLRPKIFNSQTINPNDPQKLTGVSTMTYYCKNAKLNLFLSCVIIDRRRRKNFTGNTESHGLCR